jgi:hypothetical protein
VRENRTLRLTWRELETWHGRDIVALAYERARNCEHKHRPNPARQFSTLPVRGWWCNSTGLLGHTSGATNVGSEMNSEKISIIGLFFSTIRTLCAWLISMSR